MTECRADDDCPPSSNTTCTTTADSSSNNTCKRSPALDTAATQPKPQARSGTWSDLPTRLTTISVAIPVLWAIWSHPTLRPLSFQLVHLVCCVEFSRLTRAHYVWLVPCLSTLLINVALENETLFLGCLVVTAMGVSLLLTHDAISQEQQQQQQQQQILLLLQALFLLTVPFRSWLIISSRPATGFGDAVTVLLTVWNTDTGALLLGRAIGERVTVIPKSWRARLRRVSPHKSVEGLVGGIGLGLFSHQCFLPAVLYLLRRYVPMVLPQEHRASLESKVWIGVVLAVSALLGDLWESCIKRQYHAKDAGHIIPGHGGVLDRFDSSLLAIVVYHVLVTLVENK